jgi:hypothetical protein
MRITRDIAQLSGEDPDRMQKIGRNDPCPCGSGKKYKKCCIDKIEAEKKLIQQEIDAVLAADLDEDWLDDELEELSNSVPDLVEEQHFDEALAVCERLREEWPEVVDGLDRAAFVHEAMGHHALALDFYRQALEFTERPDQYDGFDEDLRQEWRDKIQELATRLTAAEAEDARGAAIKPAP